MEFSVHTHSPFNADCYVPLRTYFSGGRISWIQTLVNEVLATQVSQVGSLLLIGQVCTDAVDHYRDESAIIHIEPIRTADELVFVVGSELFAVLHLRKCARASCPDR